MHFRITINVVFMCLKSTLDLMIKPNSGIRLQDVNLLFNNILSYPMGHQLALDFLTNRWDDIAKL